jgi:hypothetical protein
LSFARELSCAEKLSKAQELTGMGAGQKSCRRSGRAEDLAEQKSRAEEPREQKV